MEVTRALMFTSEVPKFHWEEVLLTSTYLTNSMSSCVLDFKTPFNMFKTYFPNYRFATDLSLRVFGLSVFVHIPDHNRIKLDSHDKKCIFVGYAPVKRDTSDMNQIQYYIYIYICNVLQN